MWRIIWASLAVLLVTSLVIVGACRGGRVAPPPPPSYEAPPVAEMLAVGEAATVGGLKVTVVEFLTVTEVKGQVPLETGFQYVLVHFNVENTSDVTLAPPYLDDNIVVVHKGEASGVPSLIFTPTVPLSDGRDASHYSFRSRFSGELDAGTSTDGWEAYLVPMDFSTANTFVRITFGSGEEVFWNLGKS